MTQKDIMSQKIEDDVRVRIAEFLPDAICRALTSYHLFSEQGILENDGEEAESVTAKSFADHHKACKVAIAHIDLLLKLARFAELPDAKAENGNQQIILAAMVQEAEAELKEYREKEKQSGD